MVTSKDQDFYFSRPTISSFHRRSERELGYKIGAFKPVDGPLGHRSEFRPSQDVFRPNLGDPLDP